MEKEDTTHFPGESHPVFRRVQDQEIRPPQAFRSKRQSHSPQACPFPVSALPERPGNPNHRLEQTTGHAWLLSLLPTSNASRIHQIHGVASLSLVFDFRRKTRSARASFKSLPRPFVRNRANPSSHYSFRRLGGKISENGRSDLSLFAVLHDSLRQRDESNPKIHPVTSKIRRLLAGLSKAVGSPRELANLIGEDLSSLNRKVRNESGLNLGTLLDERRLELAYSGLQAKVLPISQVAWEAGFEDPNYFSRWFKKESGKSKTMEGRRGPFLASTFYSPCLSASSASERYFLFLDFRNPMRFRRSLGDKAFCGHGGHGR